MKLFVIGVDKTTLTFLKDRGFSIASADEEIESPEDLYEWIQFENYDAIVLGLDQTNWGIYAARFLRKMEILISIVGITSGNGEDSWPDQRSVFLENGGDDLLRTPASPRELAASLRASVRRGRGVTYDIREFRNGDAVLRVDLTKQFVAVNGTIPHLTGKEMRMLINLVSAGDRVQSKEVMVSGLYSAIEDEALPKIVDVFICKIRKKFAEIHPDAGALIRTVWGRGYVMFSEKKEDAEKQVA